LDTRGEGNVSDDSLFSIVCKQALHADWNCAAAGATPDVSSTTIGLLRGSWMMQVDEIVDIANSGDVVLDDGVDDMLPTVHVEEGSQRPDGDRLRPQQSSRAHHSVSTPVRSKPSVFKLNLTDGNRRFTALEISRIDALHQDGLRAGFKIWVRDVPVSHGMLLLSAAAVNVCGGYVPELEDLRMKRDAKSGSEVGDMPRPSLTPATPAIVTSSSSSSSITAMAVGPSSTIPRAMASLPNSSSPSGWSDDDDEHEAEKAAFDELIFRIQESAVADEIASRRVSAAKEVHVSFGEVDLDDQAIDEAVALAEASQQLFRHSQLQSPVVPARSSYSNSSPKSLDVVRSPMQPTEFQIGRVRYLQDIHEGDCAYVRISVTGAMKVTALHGRDPVICFLITDGCSPCVSVARLDESFAARLLGSEYPDGSDANFPAVPEKLVSVLACLSQRIRDILLQFQGFALVRRLLPNDERWLTSVQRENYVLMDWSTSTATLDRVYGRQMLALLKRHVPQIAR
jgi:hypothetical protein